MIAVAGTHTGVGTRKVDARGGNGELDGTGESLDGVGLRMTDQIADKNRREKKHHRGNSSVRRSTHIVSRLFDRPIDCTVNLSGACAEAGTDIIP
ncbi:hypothetical protein [Rhizobium metallidurans]|uniref:Uncharacterized protein n=1 Tax=Rhizobium metallidurans TaxID=1265931 RepID=A0A7W6CLP7_9HYPH|nr:hypothetical protein [Rhizobium metallidurans]MBB3963283.1 hypothetical protein [Rhizobium metallidurans]